MEKIRPKETRVNMVSTENRKDSTIKLYPKNFWKKSFIINATKKISVSIILEKPEEKVLKNQKYLFAMNFPQSENFCTIDIISMRRKNLDKIFFEHFFEKVKVIQEGSLGKTDMETLVQSPYLIAGAFVSRERNQFSFHGGEQGIIGSSIFGNSCNDITEYLVHLSGLSAEKNTRGEQFMNKLIQIIDSKDFSNRENNFFEEFVTELARPNWKESFQMQQVYSLIRNMVENHNNLQEEKLQATDLFPLLQKLTFSAPFRKVFQTQSE